MLPCTGRNSASGLSLTTAADTANIWPAVTYRRTPATARRYPRSYEGQQTRPMNKLIAPLDLKPIPAMAATAFVALAIFAWTERTVLVDPDGRSVPYLPWKLWQIPPLLMGFGGAWWLWASTRGVPWVRSLALGTLAVVVLANAYAGAFGEYTGDVWRTVNPLFLGSASVATVAMWRAGRAAGRAGAVISALLGAVVFANAYFLSNGDLWPVLDPARMLASLAWAAGASQANVSAPPAPRS